MWLHLPNQTMMMKQLSMGRNRIISFLKFIFSFYSLQILLLSDVERVRAASIRALRYSIHRVTIFDKFVDNRLDYLICRYDIYHYI